MPDMFVTELRRQHHHTSVQLRNAEATHDDDLAEAMTSRLCELAEIAMRNGVELV